MKLNREHKDRLFRFIFSNKENLLSLYNALNGTAYNNVEDLEVTTMEDVIYIDMKNDVSFLLDCELNLYEHQSTFNPNLPLRGLLYFGKQYNKYVEKNKCNIYGTKLIELPTPKYVVFFNGKDMEEDKRILRLSDAFSKKEEGCMEVEAIMLNINYGKNREIMDKCHMLKEYAILIDKIKHYSKAYSMEERIELSLKECIEENVLKEILINNRAEVVDMILTEYNGEKMQELFLNEINMLKTEKEKERERAEQERIAKEKERERAEQERIAREQAEKEVARLKKLLELEENKPYQ